MATSSGVDTTFKDNLVSAISNTNLELPLDVVNEFTNLYSNPDNHPKLAKALDSIGINLNTLTPLPPAVNAVETQINTPSIENRESLIGEINSNLIEYKNGTRYDLEGITSNKIVFEQTEKGLMSSNEKFIEIKDNVCKLEDTDTKRIIKETMDLSESIESFGRILKSELDATYNFRNAINFDLANYQLSQLDLLTDTNKLSESINEILESNNTQGIKIGLDNLKNQIFSKIYVIAETINVNKGNAINFKDLFGSNSNNLMKGIYALPNIAIDIDSIKYHPEALEDQFQMASTISKEFNPMTEEFRKFQGNVDIPTNKMIEKMGFIHERSFKLLTILNQVFSQLQ